jgi:hypothetical protein
VSGAVERELTPPPRLPAPKPRSDVELAEQMLDGRIRSLSAAFAFAPRTDAPWLAYAHAVKIGVELGRALLQLHAEGRVSRKTLDTFLDSLEDGADRMLELMPPDPPRRRPA